MPPHNEISDKSKLSFHGVNECEVLLLFLTAQGVSVKFFGNIPESGCVPYFFVVVGMIY